MNSRIEFIDSYLCDHSGMDKDDDICYGCGMARWAAKESIKERIHRNELRRRKELMDLEKQEDKTNE